MLSRACRLFRPCGSKIFRLEVVPPKSPEHQAKAIDKLRSGHFAYDSVSIVSIDPARSKQFIRALAQQIAPEKIIPHIAVRELDELEIQKMCQDYKALGIKEAFIIDGDSKFSSAKAGEGSGVQPTLPYRRERVLTAIKIAVNLELTVGAAYHPEKHPLSLSLENDIERALAKQDAGCSKLASQVCFSEDRYQSFNAAAKARGLKIQTLRSIMFTDTPEKLRGFCIANGITQPLFLDERTDNKVTWIKRNAEYYGETLDLKYPTVLCAASGLSFMEKVMEELSKLSSTSHSGLHP